jgi:predicted metal-dependent hydrolase
MGAELDLGEITVDVVFKDIKNVHLSVYPPAGRVRIAAPSRMSLDTIRVYAISKLDWIKRQQHQIREQERETAREYLDRESHYLWGKRYLLKVIEADRAPSVEVQHSRLLLRTNPGTTDEKRQEIVSRWYRAQIKEVVPPLIAKWEPVVGVTVERWYVQQMKTKWGSCNPLARTVRLNTELAKKPKECLEYLLVHEMAHLLEPTHSARFVAIMDRYMPHWRQTRDQLNQLPVRHEQWRY